MLNTMVKRGRGRPRKTEMTKFTAKKTVGTRPKKSSRPLGSKNKLKKKDAAARIERLEAVVALLAEIISGIMSKMTEKKGK